MLFAVASSIPSRLADTPYRPLQLFDGNRSRGRRMCLSRRCRKFRCVQRLEHRGWLQIDYIFPAGIEQHLALRASYWAGESQTAWRIEEEEDMLPYAPG